MIAVNREWVISNQIFGLNIFKPEARKSIIKSSCQITSNVNKFFFLFSPMSLINFICQFVCRSAQSQMIHSGPKTIMSDAPENIAIQVQRCFKTCHPQTVNRNQKIRFNFGAPNWSQNRCQFHQHFTALFCTKVLWAAFF